MGIRRAGHNPPGRPSAVWWVGFVKEETTEENYRLHFNFRFMPQYVYLGGDDDDDDASNSGVYTK
jgi:hypothetical protein